MYIMKYMENGEIIARRDPRRIAVLRLVSDDSIVAEMPVRRYSRYINCILSSGIEHWDEYMVIRIPIRKDIWE